MDLSWILIGSASAAFVAYWLTQVLYDVVLVMKVRPGQLIQKISRPDELRAKALAAGYHRPSIVGQALVFKQVLLWVSILLFLLLALESPVGWLLSVLITTPFLYAALRGPELYWQSLGKRRQVQAARDLPRLIEALLLYVRAGLNLEGSFRELATRFTGFWQDDLRLLVLHVDSGMPFKEALTQFAARFGSPEVDRFTDALEQSRTLGVPLSQSLSVHADLLRAKRRFQAQEVARTAAVKISLPLVLFIFPALMIIFLGPAILQIMQVIQ